MPPRFINISRKPRPPPKRQRPLTFHQTVIEMLKFLEVAIHTLLYVRRIYPQELFQRKKKYEAPVYQSRHPGLNEYISGAVKAIGEELVHGTVDRVVIVIRDRFGFALERYVFKFSNHFEVSNNERDLWLKDQNIQNSMPPGILAQYFRSFLIRLNMLDSILRVIPVEYEPTFAIVLEMKDQQEPLPPAGKGRNKDPVSWVPAQSLDTSQAPDSSETHIIRTVDTGVINLSLIVQESEEKLERQRLQDELDERLRNQKSSS